jgi:hypothetical protein
VAPLGSEGIRQVARQRMARLRKRVWKLCTGKPSAVSGEIFLACVEAELSAGVTASRRAILGQFFVVKQQGR